jgi:hypothetical protein
MLVDLGAQTQRCMPTSFIHETMMAVMYRLLDMKFANSPFEEALRLGLLAYCHHIFLQWQDVMSPHHRFPIAYREFILQLEHTEGFTPELVLWLLMVGVLSFFDLAEDATLRDFFRKYANKCKVRTWNKMKNLLKTFAWIELLDEHAGKSIYVLLALGKEK